MKKYLPAVALAVALMGCDSTPKYVELESGLKFRKLVKGDTTKAQPTDVINVVMTHVEGDSVLYDSGSDPGYFVNPSVGLPPNLQEAFLLCSKGDSVQIEMPYTEYATMTGRPVGAADSSKVVTWNIKVREIENEQVVIDRLVGEQLEKDKVKINEYLVNNNLEATETEEGVSVVTLKKGNGKYPASGDKVGVNYVLRLLDGTIIDTSYEELAKENGLYNPNRDYAPYSFTLGNREVIQGWDVAIPNVDQGGKARLLIPSKLGYGSRNTGGPIPPNSVLVFDVEVVELNK